MNFKNIPILAIETATPVCSVALLTSDNRIISRRTIGSGRHAEQLMPFINELLDEAGVDVSDLGAVAVSSGPGSFTGLRVASSSLRGLLYATGIPVITCNTLSGMAQYGFEQNPDQTTIHAVIDARRQHLYYQPFYLNNGMPQPARPVEITPLDQFTDLIKPGELLVGTGTERLPEQVQSEVQIIGNEAISAETFLTITQIWVSLGCPDSELITKVAIEDYQPAYYSDGPPPPKAKKG